MAITRAPVDERELLLLGLLMGADQHAYQLNEFIERRLGGLASLKKPTAYAILARLEGAGCVSVATVQEGRRPARHVYSITPAGRRFFLEGLRRSLADLADSERVCAGLMFLEHLPPEEAAALLARRLEHVRARLALLQVGVGQPLGLALAQERLRRHLQTEADWLAEVIARLGAPLAAATHGGTQ
ncbi:MAG TPA: helix-turn-helix transcriptional regulator [Roseiflexaceae bacterium]|nr:helix-turn-helix transcriptional regulator [Roseiflexaceae bacterium]